MQKSITYEQYTNVCDAFDANEKISKLLPFFPAPEDLDKMEKSPKDFLKFLLFLDSNNPTAKTPQEKESAKRIAEIIKANLVIED